MAPGNNAPPGHLSTVEAAEYLGYTLASFYVVAKKIRHLKVRRKLYFATKDLDEFDATRSVEHVPA